MSNPRTDLRRAAIAVALSFTLVGCDGPNRPLGNFFTQEEPVPAANALPRPNPDARGVITYQTFQVAVAREGDNIETIAGRIGLSAASIAQHNGLPVTYRPRPGEVLALPQNVGGSMADNDWSPLIASNAISAAELEPLTSGSIDTTTAPAPTGTNPFANGQNTNVVEPIRHRVEPGETAFTIARRYGVAVTALATWNGLDRDMTVRVDQELLIPVTERVAMATGAVATDANPPGTGTALAPPPSSADPLPANQDNASLQTPPSPNLAATRTAPTPPAAPAPAPASNSRLLPPVAGASVLRGYDPAASIPNEGIDFAAAAGTPVRAAEQGEVALISKSLGGLGTIVLIRHADSLMTVYGRVTDVSLKKGDRVTRGQTIGKVAPGDTPNVHFEVRQGTASVDPAPFL